VADEIGIRPQNRFLSVVPNGADMASTAQ
jgi:hypothetical protein